MNIILHNEIVQVFKSEPIYLEDSECTIVNNTDKPLLVRYKNSRIKGNMLQDSLAICTEYAKDNKFDYTAYVYIQPIKNKTMKEKIAKISHSSDINR